MANDPYETLGLARDATADDVRRAFRRLAKQHHPDLNPGDKAAEDRFKAVSAANELLSDPERRARFDRGEIDAAGQPTPERPRYREYAEAEAGGRYAGSGAAGGWTEDDLGDIFSTMFGAGGPRRPAGPVRGRDESYGLTVSFLDAVNGTTTRLTLPDGRTLDVKVPPGLRDGQTLRLRGRGGAGFNGGPAGDALIEAHVAPHPHFRREGDDIHLDLPVTLREAVLGGRVTVPTPGGPVALSVPPRSDGGRQLRLRGRGVPARGDRPAGDLHVVLRVSVAEADAALDAFLRDWTPEHPVDPRRDLETEAGA